MGLKFLSYQSLQVTPSPGSGLDVLASDREKAIVGSPAIPSSRLPPRSCCQDPRIALGRLRRSSYPRCPPLIIRDDVDARVLDRFTGIHVYDRAGERILLDPGLVPVIGAGAVPFPRF